MLESSHIYLKEVHICPHCKTQMSCCEAPPIHIGDGLGWGSEVMFICLNDDCTLFIKGWEYVDRQYGHVASYRYMELPGSKESNVMMVGSEDAFKSSIIDPEALKAQNQRYQKEKEAFKALDEALITKDLEPVLFLVLDEAADRQHRQRALEVMGKIADLSVIDPVRNHKFRDASIEQDVNMVLAQILRDNFKKECPHCLEIIKTQALKCKHCHSELS
jgi:hypothetical protein